jgi:hypothetical protein
MENAVMLTALPTGVVAFQWKGETPPGSSWPAWLIAASDESNRHGIAGFPECWPHAVVSVCGQNTPAVKLSLKRPGMEGHLVARPGDWIVRTDAGHWDVYKDRTFQATFAED